MKSFLVFISISSLVYYGNCKEGNQKLCPESVFRYGNNDDNTIHGFYESEQLKAKAHWYEKPVAVDDILRDYVNGQNQNDIARIIFGHESLTKDIQSEKYLSNPGSVMSNDRQKIMKVQKDLIDYENKIEKENHFRYSQILNRVNNSLDLISTLYNNKRNIVNENLLPFNELYFALKYAGINGGKYKGRILALGWFHEDPLKLIENYYGKQLIYIDNFDYKTKEIYFRFLTPFTFLSNYTYNAFLYEDFDCIDGKELPLFYRNKGKMDDVMV